MAPSPLVRHEHVGRPLHCMLDVRFREKFQDAMAVVISDGTRRARPAQHGDFHCDEDMAGRAWHHYPLQRWAGFEGDSPAAGRDDGAVAALSNRHAAQRDLHRLALAARRRTRSSTAARLSEDLRIAQGKASKPVASASAARR